MRLFNIGVCTALVVVLLAGASPAFASGSAFSVSGQVIDRYGNPVPGANVTLLDFDYKTIGINLTTDNGNYDFINVVSEAETVTVRVNIMKDGKKYEVPSYFTRWYPSKGMVFINSRETMFPNYPPPVYGYVYGAILTDASENGKSIGGIVYLASLDSGIKYYELADRTDGKGSFVFYVPPGPYLLYAQHRENGAVYESDRKQITVQPNSDISEVLATPIILPLNKPSSDPIPAAAPSLYENKVRGTVADKDSKPIAGATVTLYQKTDNGTGFLPMKGSDLKPITTVTDANGSFQFRGVSPTTDDGKAIQAKKDIKAIVAYRLTDNLTLTAESEEEPLYYPDVFLSNGLESQARDVTLFGTMSLGDRAEPTVSVSDVPPAPAPGVAAVPLLAALALGLACIVGLYLALNRKG